MAYETPYYHPRGGLQKVTAGPEGAVARRQYDGRMVEEVDFNYYLLRMRYKDVETSIATGTVYSFDIAGSDIYLFVSTAMDVDFPLYPEEISLYATFDGTTVSDLIVTRY